MPVWPVAAVPARIMAVAVCLIRKVVQISVCIHSCALVSSKQSRSTQSLTMNTSSSNRSWWWAHFDEHPGIATREEAAYANIKEKRSKVMCQLCKIARIIDEQQQDHIAHQQGQLAIVWTQHQILEWSGYYSFVPLLGIC